MEPKALFNMEDDKTPLELIYDADRSLMPAKDLGEAILGMSTILKIAGRQAGLDFEDVYIYPVQKGSVRTFMVYIKRNQNRLIAELGVATLAGIIILSFEVIGKYGLPALKNPDAEVMSVVDKKVLELCMNADYRKGVTKVALPISEGNEKVTIKIGEKGCEITRENQYKYIHEDQEPILPELRNRETVTITGRITRINLDQNDLGFEYHGRKISISPADQEKAVGKEFHQFLETPVVTITGIVVRENEFVVPKIRVLQIEEYKPAQTTFLDKDASESASD